MTGKRILILNVANGIDFECDCVNGEPFPDGTFPEYYSDSNLAAQMWITNSIAVREHKKRYFSIHFNDRHILCVHSPTLCGKDRLNQWCCEAHG